MSDKFLSAALKESGRKLGLKGEELDRYMYGGQLAIKNQDKVHDAKSKVEKALTIVNKDYSE